MVEVVLPQHGQHLVAHPVALAHHPIFNTVEVVDTDCVDQRGQRGGRARGELITPHLLQHCLHSLSAQTTLVLYFQRLSHRGTFLRS
ncbi:hypothetical protein OG218_01265 [Kineococcus sp. NBC_00420]